MGRDKRREQIRLPPFLPLLKERLGTPAWRAMSHDANSLCHGPDAGQLVASVAAMREKYRRRQAEREQLVTARIDTR
jgi:hypothetical protein